METSKETGTRIDEALELLGYAVTEGPTDGVFKIASPDGTDAGMLTLSGCWAFLRERHRDHFESSPPIWDEERYGPFRLEFSGFCPVCGYGIFNGRHDCPGEQPCPRPSVDGSDALLDRKWRSSSPPSTASSPPPPSVTACTS